jgi:hypothetical protein
MISPFIRYNGINSLYASIASASTIFRDWGFRVSVWRHETVTPVRDDDRQKPPTSVAEIA